MFSFGISPEQALLCGFLLFIDTLAAPPPDLSELEPVQAFIQVDSELGFGHKTNCSVIHKSHVTTTDLHLDSRGARIGAADEPEISEVGLIAVGGSQTYGPGVLNRETFASLTAEKLGLSARNFGINGQGGVQSLIVLKRHIDLKPKVVVYGFWFDHFNRNVRICQNAGGPTCTQVPTVQFNPDEQPYIRFPENAEMNYRRRLEWGRDTAEGSESRSILTDLKWTCYELYWDFTRWMGLEINAAPTDQEKIYRGAEFVLQGLKGIAEEAGAVLVVAFIPDYLWEGVHDTPAELIAMADRLDIPLIGVSEQFRKLRSEGKRISIEGDGHLNERGHAVIAEEVCKYLVEAGFEGGG